MKRWVGACFLVAGCSPQEEIRVAPDAQITVTQDGAEWASLEARGGALIRFPYPKWGPHEVRLHADGRPDVVGRFQVVEGDGAEGSSANEIVPHTDDVARTYHPARFLRGTDGTFALPERSQGVVITVDAPAASATFLCPDPSGILMVEVKVRLRHGATQIGDTIFSEAVAQELPVGTCEASVTAGSGTHLTWTGEVAIVAGRFEWLHVHLARDEGRSAGGNWPR